MLELGNHIEENSKFNEMVKAATSLFEAIDNGSADKDALREKLTAIEAEFSDNPAYLAMIRMEYKLRTR